MKTLKYFLIALVAISLSACKGDETLSLTSGEIQGPLGEYFEVVAKDYKAEDGRVAVEIKRIKAGFPKPWKENMDVGYHDGEVEPCFTIQFQDADGKIVSNDKTDIVYDIEKLKAIASLSTSESTTITFDCDQGAKQFSMGSSFAYHGEEEVTVNMAGSIGKYPVVMTMHIAVDGSVTGAYYYKSTGLAGRLYIKGNKSDEKITINEFTTDGRHTGSFEGVYQDGVFKGQFNTQDKTYDFVLNPIDMEAIDFSDVDFNSFNIEYNYGSSIGEDYSSDSAGSSDWDSLLDTYEQYVDKYISCVKKAANGDATALVEYPSLLEKAQELSNKLQDAQGNMSSSQLDRYMQITNKMAQAAQEMR